MADIKDKQYSALKENLENMGKGAAKHDDDTEKPLPENITEKRYVEAEEKLTDLWQKAQQKLKEKNEAFKELQLGFKTAKDLYNTDVHLIKGIYTIYSQTLRDYGIQPQKKPTGRKKKSP